MQYVLLVQTICNYVSCMNTELCPGPHISDGTYSRVDSPGKRWLINKINKKIKYMSSADVCTQTIGGA